MSCTAADMSSAPTAATGPASRSVGSLFDRGWSRNKPVSGNFHSVNCGVSGSGDVVGHGRGAMVGGGTFTSSFRVDLADPMEGERVLPPACRLLDLLPRRRVLASTGCGTLTRWIVCCMAGFGLRGTGHRSTESVSVYEEFRRADAAVVRYSRYDGGGGAGLFCQTGDGWGPCSQAYDGGGPLVDVVRAGRAGRWLNRRRIHSAGETFSPYPSAAATSSPLCRSCRLLLRWK